jgi:4-aminobutyrate aminotransferase
LELVETGLMANAAAMGEFALDALAEIQSRHRSIGEVRGKGLMVGAELVLDHGSKRPDHELRERVLQEAFDRGLLLLGAGESAIRVVPALSIDQGLLDEGLRILEASLSAAEGR